MTPFHVVQRIVMAAHEGASRGYYLSIRREWRMSIIIQARSNDWGYMVRNMREADAVATKALRRAKIRVVSVDNATPADLEQDRVDELIELSFMGR